MKKIFYFLDIWITQEDYNFFIDKIFLLSKGVSVKDIIDKFYYKIWEDNWWKINKSFFLEAITFIDYAKKELDIEFPDITWVYKENFLLSNSELYIFDENELNEIDIKNTYFVNIRYPWFNHIFRIFTQLWWTALWVNHRWDWIYNDKIFCISKLYKGDLKKYVGDVIIPFINNFNESTIKVLYNFINANFSTNKIVLKKSFWEMWNGVKAVDLLNTDFRKFYSIIQKQYTNTYNVVESFYIVPFYEILTENRIYYLYDKKSDSLEIYCVKQKNTNFEWVFELESFELYKGIQVDWSYVNKDDIINNKSLYLYIKEIAQLIWYETWVLELGVLGENNFRFFEVNPYGGSLMFKEDQEDMYNFCYNMYKNKFSNY